MTRFCAFQASCLLYAAALAVTAAPRPVAAQSDDERARFHFQAGRSYYDQGSYENAVREWQESYRLSSRPLLLRNIAEAQERLFAFDDAIETLEQYLREGGEEAASNRTTIESRIARLRQQAEEYRRRTASGTETGGAETGGAETGGAETGGAETGGAETGGAETGGAETGETPERPRRAGWIWAWVGLGATGLFAIGATATGVLALGAKSDLEENCPDNVCPADMEDTRDQGNALAITTDVFIGLASAAAVATVLLFFLEPRPELPAQVSLAPWLGPSARGFGAVLRF